MGGFGIDWYITQTQDGRMTKKCGVRLGVHSLATFFRHFAVLNLPAVLLPKLPNIMKQRALVLILSLSGCIFSKLISLRAKLLNADWKNPEKNLSEQSKEPTTYLTHSWPEPGPRRWKARAFTTTPSLHLLILPSVLLTSNRNGSS